MGVDTPKTVFVDSADDLERGVEEIGFPCIFKPVESLAFKTRFRRHVLEIGSADELARGLRQGGRLRHADAAGHRAGRRRGALHARLVPRRAEPAAGAVHRPQAAPAPAAVRPRQHGGEQVGARARGGGAAPAPRARLPRRQPGRVQARPARRRATASWRSTRVTGCGTRSAPPAASTSRSPPTATPSASRTSSARQVDGLKWVVSLTDARDAFSRWRSGEEKLLPWLKSYRGVRVDGLYSLRDPLPGALLTARQLQNIVHARRQAGRGRVAVRFGRFLAAAAAQPPAAVFQVSYACGLDVVRDLGRHGVPVLALDPDPAAHRPALALRRRPRLPRPARRRGGVPHLPRDARRAAAAARRRLPQPRRVHLAALAPRRAARAAGSSCRSRAGT